MEEKKTDDVSFGVEIEFLNFLSYMSPPEVDKWPTNGRCNLHYKDKEIGLLHRDLGNTIEISSVKFKGPSDALLFFEGIEVFLKTIIQYGQNDTHNTTFFFFPMNNQQYGDLKTELLTDRFPIVGTKNIDLSQIEINTQISVGFNKENAVIFKSLAFLIPSLKSLLGMNPNIEFTGFEKIYSRFLHLYVLQGVAANEKTGYLKRAMDVMTRKPLLSLDFNFDSTFDRQKKEPLFMKKSQEKLDRVLTGSKKVKKDIYQTAQNLLNQYVNYLQSLKTNKEDIKNTIVRWKQDVPNASSLETILTLDNPCVTEQLSGDREWITPPLFSYDGAGGFDQSAKLPTAQDFFFEIRNVSF